MRTKTGVVALVGGLVLVASACGEAPEESNTATGGDFTACMVSDAGGVNDKSFNESSWRGVTNAEEAGYTSSPQFTESQEPADYGPNVDAMVAEDCSLIVTVGHELADVTEATADSNPEEQFAIVDFRYTDENETPIEIDNIKPLVFDTHEAAFLAGYVAAEVSETGTVATWGGMQIPTVTIFMDGFVDGVAHYNEVKGTDVEVLGWDKEAQDGEFTMDFNNTGLAKQISDNLIQQGADVLLPVAGPLGESAAVAAEEAGDVNIIWVDSDGYESVPEYSHLMVTSIMKAMDLAVEETIRAASEDNYSNEAYIGTLDNDGVGLAPYHDFADVIPQEVQDEVDQLRADIISGELEVTSDASF